MQKLSERAADEFVRGLISATEPRTMEQIIADATGCDEAAEIIRLMEWGGPTQKVGDIELATCGCCELTEAVGHSADCRLAAYLAKYGTKRDKTNVES